MRSKLLFAKDFSALLFKFTGLVMIAAALGALTGLLLAHLFTALGGLCSVLLIFTGLLTLCAWAEAKEKAKRRAGRER
ncbi:hypothetical protein EJV44_15415 [Ancylobacter aquaticus]|nr:hypothetical protein EJV44_15415 [Ancylobacter aquaticus]